VDKLPNFSLVRPKNKLANKGENPQETLPNNIATEKINQPKNIEEIAEPQINKDQTTQPEKTTIIEIEVERRKPAANIPDTIVTEMQIINSMPKEKIVCPNCKKTFGTPLFMYDYSAGKSKLVSCCPFCNNTIKNKLENESENKQQESTVNVETSSQPATKTHEAPKKSVMQFQINNQELEELVRSTSYVR
jgi:hypothetical protein